MNGVMLIAKDTDAIAYGSIADWQTKNIHTHLSLPVSIITDSNTRIDKTLYETVIIDDESSPMKSARYFADIQCTSEWKNSGRYMAYRHSPYDRTLLIDVDYCVQADDLLKLFDIKSDFLCFGSAVDLTFSGRLDNDMAFGISKMNMAWATVVYFNKSVFSDSVFRMMEMVQNNYSHYANLYGFSPTPYRNDFALSIALNTLGGHMPTDRYYIPWNLATIPTDADVDFKNGKFVLGKQYHGKPTKYFEVCGHDVHVMPKSLLQRIALNEK